MCVISHFLRASQIQEALFYTRKHLRHFMVHYQPSENVLLVEQK